MAGGALLMLSAACIDLGGYVEQPQLSSVDSAPSVLAGLGVRYVPLGLVASGLGRSNVFAAIGSVCPARGTLTVSLFVLPWLDGLCQVLSDSFPYTQRYQRNRSYAVAVGGADSR